MASIEKTFTAGGINATLFDSETTGLNFRTEQIIEACLIKVRNSQPVAVINLMVRYEGELKEIVTKVTGHTTEDVNNAPLDHNEALDMIDTFIQDDTIIAYNGLFDLSFLETMYRMYQGDRDMSYRFNKEDQLRFDLIDPLVIARDRYPYPHKLGDMCKRLGITLDEAHSAYHDTFALLDLTLELHEKESIESYYNFVRYKDKYGEPEWCPNHIRLESDRKTANSSTSTGITKQAKEQAKTINKLMPKIVTKNKKKKIPDVIVPDDLFPLHDRLKGACEALISGDIKAGSFEADHKNARYPSMMCQEHEFKAVWEYLTKDLEVSEDELETDFDGEVLIVYTGYEG